MTRLFPGWLLLGSALASGPDPSRCLTVFLGLASPDPVRLARVLADAGIPMARFDQAVIEVADYLVGRGAVPAGNLFAHGNGIRVRSTLERKVGDENMPVVDASIREGINRRLEQSSPLTPAAVQGAAVVHISVHQRPELFEREAALVPADVPTLRLLGTEFSPLPGTLPRPFAARYSESGELDVPLNATTVILSGGYCGECQLRTIGDLARGAAGDRKIVVLPDATYIAIQDGRNTIHRDLDFMSKKTSSVSLANLNFREELTGEPIRNATQRALGIPETERPAQVRQFMKNLLSQLKQEMKAAGFTLETSEFPADPGTLGGRFTFTRRAGGGRVAIEYGRP